MAAANDEIGELKMRAQGADGRITALEAQLARTEGNKREVEYKLSQLHSTLRRTIGLRVGGRSCSPPPRGGAASKGLASTGSQRSNSPVRAWSPTRLERYVAEVDPETVRIAMVDFIQQLKDTERERDELQVRLTELSRNSSLSERVMKWLRLFRSL